MIELTLPEIAGSVSGALILPPAVPVSKTVSGAVETDSRLIRPGGIFVAKRGEETDGHLFAGDALERGAALVIAEHRLELAVPQIIVEDSVIALGLLAAEVVARVRADGNLTVIGITGSNGKTTTKNLLRTILEKIAPTVAPRESFNNEVGAPLTMLQIDHGTRYLVSEMGASRPGEIARLAGLAKPDVGVVLKVGMAHAGVFGGIEATAAAKSEMVRSLGPGGVAVLNRDDVRVARMAELTDGPVVWFGLDPRADVRAEQVVSGAAGTRFRIRFPAGDSREVAFRILGEHHVYNALAAAAVADRLGVPHEIIVAALQEVTRAERWRMEVLGGARGVTIINDAYNASPDSMAAALKTLARIAGPENRTVAVLGEMAELGEESGSEHDEIGLLAVRLNIAQVVVVGRGARRMHISTINEGSWDGESEYFDTPEAAFESLSETLRPGDLVLVKSSKSAGLRFLGDRLGELFS